MIRFVRVPVILWTTLPWAILLSAAFPTEAFAHAFAQRYDLPLPLGFYLAGAGIAVALSFLGTLFIRRPERIERFHLDISLPHRLSHTIYIATSVAFLLILALVLATGFFGSEVSTRNPATVTIWVLWWVGFTLFTALVIDAWSPCNPFRTLVGLLPKLKEGEAPNPPRLAAWCPLAGLLLLSWLELVSDLSENPRAMATIIILYIAFLAAGSLRYGAAQWFGAADPLTRLFAYLGHAAPLAARPAGLRMRLPAIGLADLRTRVDGACFIIALIAVVLFDGLSETPIWAGILEWVTQSQTLRPGLLALRDIGVDLLKLLRTIGLLGTVLIAMALYAVLVLAMWRASGRARDLPGIAGAFAASLLPIAIAYHLAHYASYLALAGQLILPAISDPFGLGWNLIGFANHRIDLGVIAAENVWWIAFGALVVGHGLSVVIAHAEAFRVFQDRRAAIRSQVPMIVFMVGLTSFSLWVLSQPIVE